MKILVIEDEPRIAELIGRYLERAGYGVHLATDGLSGLAMARELNPDLILLDIVMPGLNGHEVCERLRRESSVPIIMLTARGSRDDKLRGLSGGADDYIVKPYDPEELIVRIRAVLRRSKGTQQQVLTCGSLELHESEQSVYLQGAALSLSHAQFSILAVFMRHPGTVLSRAQIIDRAFGGDYDAYERAIDTHIRRLRKSLGDRGVSSIETVYGAGYRMRCH